VRKRSFRTTLKLTLQHSKQIGALRLPSPTEWERAGGEGNKKRVPLAPVNPSDVPLGLGWGRDV